MRLSLRRRLFLAMVGLGTVPLAVAILVLTVQVRSTVSPQGPRAAIDRIAESGRALVAAVDTTALAPDAAAALQDHTAVVTRGTQLARRADMLTRVAAGTLGAVVLLAGVILVAVSLGLAGRWSRLVSKPIEELVDWVGRIERREPLPQVSGVQEAQEFDQLREALRAMAGALDRARVQELERERLRAFRETARRVAHEMRGPLSAARLALRQLPDRDHHDAIEVLREETQRLEQMATEFSAFGRLPEGPESDVDVSALLQGALTAAVPDDVPCDATIEPHLILRGRYEPLRRALVNLITNALDATDRRGIAVSGRLREGVIEVRVADHGPGVSPELRGQVFQPYFTTKRGGTGLGLAMVHQIVLEHGGTVSIEDDETYGAVFVVRLKGTS